MYLPQVATDMGWEARELLEEVGMKAGVPRDAWLDPEVTVSLFRTLCLDVGPVDSGARPEFDTFSESDVSESDAGAP